MVNEQDRRYAGAVKRCIPLLALALALGACRTTRPIRGEEGPLRAVVFCPPELREAGEAIARALEKRDFTATCKVTPLPRDRSAFAVYGLHDHPDRLDEMKRFADDLGGDVEFLPFQQHATGGNAVVVWLAAAKTEAK